MASFRRLEELERTISYGRPTDKSEYTCRFIAVAGAACNSHHGQLCYFTGLRIGDFQCEAMFQNISWTLHKSCRTVKSFGAAEILIAGLAINEGRSL